MRQPSSIGEVKFEVIMDALRDLDAELEQRVHPLRKHDRRSGRAIRERSYRFKPAQ
jgi:hypothetical protein